MKTYRDMLLVITDTLFVIILFLKELTVLNVLWDTIEKIFQTIISLSTVILLCFTAFQAFLSKNALKEAKKANDNMRIQLELAKISTDISNRAMEVQIQQYKELNEPILVFADVRNFSWKVGQLPNLDYIYNNIGILPAKIEKYMVSIQVIEKAKLDYYLKNVRSRVIDEEKFLDIAPIYVIKNNSQSFIHELCDLRIQASNISDVINENIGIYLDGVVRYRLTEFESKEYRFCIQVKFEALTPPNTGINCISWNYLQSETKRLQN